MPHRFTLILAALTLALPLAAQTRPATPATPATVIPAALKPYVSCKIVGGPDMLQTTPLPKAPMTRTAQTLMGPRTVTITNGLMAAFAFPDSAPFANVKIEQLPAANYASEKAALIGEFDAINAKGEDTERNYTLKPTLNGFEIYGFDRKALHGPDVLLQGIYLFFDKAHHVATTAYFLNAPAGQRRFSNVQEYDGLREGFLNAYTLCVRKALSGAPPSKAPAKRAAHKARKR